MTNPIRQSRLQFHNQIQPNYKMKRIIQILISRDGLTFEEAKNQLVSFCQRMEEDLENGGSPFEWENEFVQEFGLEPDYFEDIIFAMC